MNALAAALSEPVPAALPVSADPNLLRDLFFGDYEPEIFKVSPELQRVGQTVSQDDKALTATLSEDSMKLLEKYETAVSERNIAATEQAYEAGIRAAVRPAPYYGIHSEPVPRKVNGAFLQMGSRYCTRGEKIRVFKRSAPKVYVPSWCPRRKEPDRIYVMNKFFDWKRRLCGASNLSDMKGYG